MTALKVGSVLAGIVLAVTAASTPRTMSLGTISPCRQNTESSAATLSTYRHIALLTDSSGVAWRQRIGLSALDSNLVTLVSDTTVCRTALNAYNSALLPDTGVSTAVDVVKYGTTRYVVADSARRGGEWEQVVIFNSLFTQVVARTAR